MAIENLFIRNERSINGIKVDGILSESTDVSVRTTTNPVEFGADITDHVINDPTILTLNGVITDTPLGLAALTASIGGALDPASGLTGSSEERGLTRSQGLYKQLVAMLKERQLVQIQSNLETYDDLIFLSISVDQDKDTSKAVFFTAVFMEALLVEGAEQTSNAQDNVRGDENSKSYGDVENGGTVSTRQPTEAGTEVILR